MPNLTLQDGTVVGLTVNMGAMYKLRKEKPEVVDDFFKSVSGDVPKDESRTDMYFRAARILYAGYLGELVREGKLETAMEYEAFLDVLPEGPNQIVRMGTMLMSPNSKRDSEEHSSSTQRKAKTP